jgi:hypothetical protein
LSNLSSSLETESLQIVCATIYEMRMLTDLILAQSRINKGSKAQFGQKAATHQMNEMIANIGQSGQPPIFRLPNSSLSYKSNLNSQHNNQINKQNTFKMFCMRPHPPLMPHFQLPGDFQSSLGLSSSETASNNFNQNCGGTLKRFMYKKPKLCEPFGKCKLFLILI